MLADIRPPLTTVRLPLTEIGATAARLAIGRSGSDQVVRHTIRPELAVRASTPPRPAG